MTARTGRAVREAIALREAEAADTAALLARRRAAGPAACRAAEISDLAALRARRAYERRAVAWALATRVDCDEWLASMIEDSRRIRAYIEARWPLSGLIRRDHLDRAAS